jgi:hypothetical protein
MLLHITPEQVRAMPYADYLGIYRYRQWQLERQSK